MDLLLITQVFICTVLKLQSRSQRSKSCGLDLFTDAIASLQAQFELLFDAGRVQVLLEDEKVAFVIKHDELRVAEGHNRIDPERDMRAGTLNKFDLVEAAGFELESGHTTAGHVTNDDGFC